MSQSHQLVPNAQPSRNHNGFRRVPVFGCRGEATKESAAAPDNPITSYACLVPIYAAYGSNMDPEQMLKRCPHSPVYGTGWLEGWRLTFAGDDIGWEGPLATVVEEPRSRVFVVLYDVSAEDELSLDRWEGSDFGIHKKIRLRVTPSPGTGTEPVLAWLYVLDAYEGGLPSARYIGVISDAAEKAGAPAEYVHALRTRNSKNVGPGTFGP